MNSGLSRLDALRIRDSLESPGEKRYLYRPRSYDEAILRYIAYHRVATVHQVIYRFFIYAGRGGRYGYNVIRRLISDGLVRSDPLDPEIGAVSRNVLSLTPKGWGIVGMKPAEDTHAAAQLIREYRLQFTEVMLEREAEGWRLIHRTQVFNALREAALASYRDRLLNDSEAVIRERLEKMPAQAMTVHGLVHRQTGEVRLLLPVRRGKSYKSTIDTFPNVGLIGGINVELICSEINLAQPARHYLERWAGQRKTKIAVHQVPHFRSRKAPSSRGDGVNRYGMFGLDVLNLI